MGEFSSIPGPSLLCPHVHDAPVLSSPRQHACRAPAPPPLLLRGRSPQQYPPEAQLTFQELIAAFRGPFASRLSLEVGKEAKRKAGRAIAKVEISAGLDEEAAPADGGLGGTGEGGAWGWGGVGRVGGAFEALAGRAHGQTAHGQTFACPSRDWGDAACCPQRRTRPAERPLAARSHAARVIMSPVHAFIACVAFNACVARSSTSSSSCLRCSVHRCRVAGYREHPRGRGHEGRNLLRIRCALSPRPEDELF
jgi:hypothetical protein